MRELVIISGKGGTGKTSVAASFAVLADRPVIADCDVDAADLHLVLSPRIIERHEFRSGHEAVIRQQDCIGCGACLAYCRFGAVLVNAGGDAGLESGEGRLNCEDCDYCRRSCTARTNADIRAMKEALGDTQAMVFTIDPVACEGCGVCVRFCPVKAIDFPERLCGEWMVSETRCGPMVHARLGVAAENSGKLVSTVRREARRIAEAENRSLIIVDGPPGIGCPVIASVTGATLVLAVTEPTVSGEHDLQRVLSLTRHFKIPTAVCVNKWDLNPEMTARIENKARQAGARITGRIRYDRAVTLAQMRERAVVEIEAPCVEDIQGIWNQLGLSEAGGNTNCMGHRTNEAFTR
jgi:MinD superfamily P-loop ATPase